MVLIILRLVFGLAMAYCIRGAMQNAEQDPMGGDIANAGWLALSVIVGIANAVVWAPFLGAKVAQAMTGSITESTYMEQKNHLLRLIYWLQGRGFRRLAAFFCFFEGIHHPELPTAFVIGMKNARPGSWLEKVFAREVFRFENVQNCITAYKILKQRGIDPRPHQNAQVTLALQEIDRVVGPDPELLKVPKAQPPELKRNSRIQIFDSAAKKQPGNQEG